MMTVFGIIIGFFVGCFFAVFAAKADKGMNVIVIIISICVIAGAIFGIRLDRNLHNMRSGSTTYSSTSSSGGKDENGLKKKECPVCHKEYTDADNKKSLRLYSMCTQCKKNYDTAQKMIEN